MSPETTALIEALKAITEGQKEILEELKKLKSTEDLVPVVMPDKSVRLVPKSSLQATTQGQSSGKMTHVEHGPLREPWPDPSTPKPPLVR